MSTSKNPRLVNYWRQSYHLIAKRATQSSVSKIYKHFPFSHLLSEISDHILLFLEIMAEALVAGAFLSGFINVMFDRLISHEDVNLIKGKKLDPELVERLKTALCGAEALLVDAEGKQFENPLVKKWLTDIQDAVYKAGDSLDHVFTKAATQNKVHPSLPRFLNFKDRKMVSKIEVEVRRIENLEKRKYILGLKDVSRDNNNYSSWRTPSTSLVKGNIYGREADQKAMTKIINDGGDHQLSVIPIVGMGGVGKTTLAQWIYNNRDLMEGFDLKAWVCISEDFDIVKVTKTIIEEITKTTCDLNNFNRLQLDLKEKLLTRKFFIVLDDVWDEDRHRWNEFKIPFQYGAQGSTILVTTRSQYVASIIQTCSPYFLNGLSDDYCWSMFRDNACLTELNGSPALEEIGREIVKKCKGLPLAAETLGCMLRTQRDVEEWKKVLLSAIWEIPLKNSKIIPALLISYYHLPSHLKRCFVYCSLFPKDHNFVKDELILLWMAEDLLRPPNRGETLEEVGNECFDNLAFRLFFKQHRKWNGDECFVMHDLLHDLAMFLAGDFYCRLEELGKAKGMSSQTRHLSYGSLSHPISTNFDTIDKVQSLRTFLPVNFSRPSFSIECMPHIILSKLKFLRVLSFRSSKGLDLLPDSIGKLNHLRYLDLSYSSIKTLPESLCGLYNLQTLKLFKCNMLQMLPRGMCNLVNLRHLDIRETGIKEMPTGISKPKHLHLYLGQLAVGRQKDSARINELGEISIPVGKLELTNLENIADCDEAMGAKLMDKTQVDDLILKWSDDGGDIVSNTQSERDIFDKLQPHHGLKVLQIHGYRGTRFPNWIGHCSYYNMTCISLWSCRSCCLLPSLGQLPSLKSLHIENFHKMEKIGIEFYKTEDGPSSASPFLSLKYLTFERMPCWEVWSTFDSNNAFPKLERLIINDCPILKGDLPNHLHALVELEIWHCLSVISLPWDFLAESLTSLSIVNCRKLEFPSQQQQNHKLKKLELYHSCDSLTLLQLEAFPKLEYLTIVRCENIESFSLSMSQPHHMFNKFDVTKCKKLKSLPSHMNTHLPNLEHLRIWGSPDIDSFPEGGLPSSLKTLDVKNCEKLLSNLSSMGVNQSLTRLEIDGYGCDSIKSFPNIGSLLGLPSLTFMSLRWFPNLETLECNQLLHLTSLQKLEILFCPKLESIVGERLPHSLIQLEINYCPLLGERCEKKQEKIWPKISHISSIQVNNILVV